MMNANVDNRIDDALNDAGSTEIDDDIPVGRVLSRREAMALLGVSGLVLLAGCGGGSGAVSTTGTTTTGTTSTTTGVTSAGAASETSGTTTTSTASGTTTTSGGTVNLVATPAVTEGPFFVDENLNRSALATGTTRASVVNGLPLALSVGVYTLASGVATPLTGAHVDIWHCDTAGTYSDEAASQLQTESTKGQTWLRGYQVTDANGAVGFTTIYPIYYNGRTAHIHFKIRTYDASGNKTHEFTSQFFFDDTISDTVFAGSPYNATTVQRTRNANDSVYSATESDGTTVGSHLLLTLAKNTSGTGYTGTFSIALVLS